METREKARETEMVVEEVRGDWVAVKIHRDLGEGEWKDLNGSKRKIEYDGGNTVKGRKAKRKRERERERGIGVD